jgi:hypothetical protein
MAKKLLLLLCIVQIRLIQTEVFSANAKDCFYHQTISSPTLATIELLEKEKAALISKIKENDTTLERLRFTSNASHHSFYYGCHNSTLSEFFLGALIVTMVITAKSPDMKKIHALENEQIKNKDKVTQLEASLETAYFEQLNPEWKKKFLKSKIEAYGLESAKITNEIPALEKTAAKKPFYSRLGMLSGANLIGIIATLPFLKPQPNGHPYLAAYSIASIFATIGILAKAKETEESIKSLEIIKKKRAEITEKTAQLSADLATL